MFDEILNNNNNSLIKIKNETKELIFLHKKNSKFKHILKDNGEFNPFESDLYGQMLSNGDNIIEVGSYLGEQTLQLANKVGNEGRIFAYEMQPLSFQLLSANAALNSIENIRASASFVSEQSTSGSLFINSAYSEVIKVIALDDEVYLQKISHIKMLKVAINTSTSVLKGASELIKYHKPILYLKKETNKKSFEQLNYLFSIHYKVYSHISSDQSSDNLLCMHKSISQNIQGLEEIKSANKMSSKVKVGDKIKVAFIVICLTKWKLETVYKRMLDDENFTPKLFVCPMTSESSELQMLEMNKIFDYFQNKGFIVQRTDLNNESNRSTTQYIDIKKEFNPNVIFFETQYSETLPQYTLNSFRDILSCHVPYHHQQERYTTLQYNTSFHHNVNKSFYTSELHKQLAKQTKNKGVNIEVTGYTGAENLLTAKEGDAWGKNVNGRTKIILAPHHLINDLFIYTGDTHAAMSTFLIYCDVFIKLAKKHAQQVIFAFKPHPNLKRVLFHEWGADRTEQYYSFWENNENTLLATGTYASLFAGSDAMIHDSGSFTVDYLYTQKPVMYLIRNEKTRRAWYNEFGLQAFDAHYHAHTKEDIEAFVLQVIENKSDDLKSSRKIFFDSYLYKDEDNLPSIKIIESIKKACFSDENKELII